jgi:hypothetical protein
MKDAVEANRMPKTTSQASNEIGSKHSGSLVFTGFTTAKNKAAVSKLNGAGLSEFRQSGIRRFSSTLKIDHHQAIQTPTVLCSWLSYAWISPVHLTVAAELRAAFNWHELAQIDLRRDNRSIRSQQSAKCVSNYFVDPADLFGYAISRELRVQMALDPNGKWDG